MKQRGFWIVLAAAAAVVAFAITGQGSKLFINGNLASSNVIDRNGVAYVPVKDVAAAMKMTVQKTAKGYELADSGGAGQINGVNGKVGDTLWNGYARFQVLEVVRGKSYSNRFSGDKQVVTGYPEGNDVVVLICRIKNGTKATVTCGLPSGNNTGLTDTNERSYGPRTGLSIDCPSRGQQLLPGSAVDFALTFDVPADAKLKDLVYEVVFYGELKASEKKFRVNLN